MRLPGLGHAAGDPLHGGARIRRPAEDDLQVLLSAAPFQRTSSAGRAARVDARAYRRRFQSHEERRLGGLQKIHHQRENERQGKSLSKNSLNSHLKMVYFFQVWDLFYEADKVREMLVKKIQEETMRTYLFTYSKVYDSISVVSGFSSRTIR